MNLQYNFFLRWLSESFSVSNEYCTKSIADKNYKSSNKEIPKIQPNKKASSLLGPKSNRLDAWLHENDSTESPAEMTLACILLLTSHMLQFCKIRMWK